MQHYLGHPKRFAAANDNDFEPPSTTVGAAWMIPTTSTDKDVLKRKDAAPALALDYAALSGIRIPDILARLFAHDAKIKAAHFPANDNQ